MICRLQIQTTGNRMFQNVPITSNQHWSCFPSAPIEVDLNNSPTLASLLVMTDLEKSSEFSKSLMVSLFYLSKETTELLFILLDYVSFQRQVEIFLIVFSYDRNDLWLAFQIYLFDLYLAMIGRQKYYLTSPFIVSRFR